MKQDKNLQAKMTELVAQFKKELDPEYIQHIIHNRDYSLPFVGNPVNRVIKDDKTATMLLKAESASMTVLNKYYTQLLREELIKINT